MGKLQVPEPRQKLFLLLWTNQAVKDKYCVISPRRGTYWTELTKEQHRTRGRETRKRLTVIRGGWWWIRGQQRKCLVKGQV